MTPHANTPCVDCRQRGHFCQAQIFVEEQSLCLNCADSEPCSYDRVARQATETPLDAFGEPLTAPPPVIHRSPEEISGAPSSRSEGGKEIAWQRPTPRPQRPPAPAVIPAGAKRSGGICTSTQEKAMPPKASIPKETKAAILAADRSIPAKELAEKLGVRTSTIYTVRHETKRAAGSKPAPKSKPRAGVIQSGVIQSSAKPKPEMMPAVRSLLASFVEDLPVDRLDKIWLALPSQAKVKALRSVLETEL